MIPHGVRLMGRSYSVNDFPEICALVQTVTSARGTYEESAGLHQLLEAIRSAEMSAIEEAEELCSQLGAQRIAQTRLQA